MRFCKRFSVAVIFLNALNVSVHAEGNNEMSQIEIGKKYYQALYAGDHAQVKELAAIEMVFEDPTAPPEFGIPPSLNNLESFLAFMQESLQGEINIKYTDSYVSNDRVVLTIETKGVIPASIMGMGRTGMVEYQSHGVSVLHVVEGKVIRHTDYFDYSELASSFNKIER